MLKEKGFTAMELVIVVAIVAILASIAVPNFIAYNTRARLRGAESNLVANFELARATAIRENGNVAVVFNANGLGYVVFEDFNSNWAQDGDERLLRNITLPPGVSVNIPTTFPGDRMRFNSRGFPDGAFGTATLSNPEGNRSVVVNIVGRVRRQ